MQYKIPFPTNFRAEDDDAGVVHSYLESRGHVVNGVSISLDEQVIVVDSDSDPTSIFTKYSPVESPKTKAQAALTELNVLNLDTADVASLRRALKLIRGLLNYEFRSS